MSRKIKRLKVIRAYLDMHPEKHFQKVYGLREDGEIVSLCIGGVALLFFSDKAIWHPRYMTDQTEHLSTTGSSGTLEEVQRILGLSYVETCGLVHETDEVEALKSLDRLISLGK